MKGRRLYVKGLSLVFSWFFISLFFSVSLAYAISPGTYYVDIDSGDDGNDGTSSGTGAWKTLHYAIQQINDGDPGTYILYMAAGPYSVGNEEDDSILTITRDNVTIQGAGAGNTIIDGTTSVSAWFTGIKIEASTGNVTFKDLDVKGFGNEGIAIYDGTGNIIEGCEIYGNGTGILIQSALSTSDNIIRNNEIYRNWDFEGIVIDGSNGNEIYLNSLYDNWYAEGPGIGIEIINGADNNLIHDNNIYWSGPIEAPDYPQGKGIYLYNAGSGNKIYQNEIHDHEGLDYYGIKIENSSPEISKNKIYSNSTGIYISGDNGTASPTIINNLIYDSSKGVEVWPITSMGYASPSIYHNTIDGINENYGIYVFEDINYSTAEIKFNIITNFDYGIYYSGSSPAIIIDYNNLYGHYTGSYYGCSAGPNDISEDPLYGSYHLQPGSLCIDAIPTGDPPGDPVKIDFPGYLRPRDGGYDMGAYEFVSDITQDYSLPGGSGDVSDYRIFTVPVELETGSALKAQMEEALGTYDKGLWRVFAWDPSSSYIEMDDPAFATLSVYPGRAFWIISTSTDTISFSGQPAPDGGYVKIPLTPGWHMVALPWPATSIELDRIAVSDGLNNYWITSDSNSLTQQYVWEYTGTGPDSGYEQLASGSTLKPGKGYWIKVLSDSSVTVLVPKDNTGGYFEASSRGVGRSSTGTGSDEEPPPPPGISVSFTSNPSDGATVSAEGGCFIATAAYGSRPHQYVKTLRGFASNR